MAVEPGDGWTNSVLSVPNWYSGVRRPLSVGKVSPRRIAGLNFWGTVWGITVIHNSLFRQNKRLQHIL